MCNFYLILKFHKNQTHGNKKIRKIVTGKFTIFLVSCICPIKASINLTKN